MMLTARRRPLLMAGTWLVAAFLTLPALVVLPVSLTDTRYLGLPENGLSLMHWNAMVTSQRSLQALWESAVIGAAATVIALVCGTACAIGSWRLSNRWADTARLVMLAPLILPPIIYALGLYRVYVTFELLDTRLGVIIAHAVTALPYVVITVSASLANFDIKLEQAARSLGATLPQTVRRVILPAITPGVLSGAIFAFVHSWDELVVTLFIAGRDVFTMPRLMWDGINESLDPMIAAVASAMMLLSLALFAINAAIKPKTER